MGGKHKDLESHRCADLGEACRWGPDEQVCGSGLLHLGAVLLPHCTDVDANALTPPRRALRSGCASD